MLNAVISPLQSNANYSGLVHYIMSRPIGIYSTKAIFSDLRLVSVAATAKSSLTWTLREKTPCLLASLALIKDAFTDKL